jgi:YesN/AraC family two-component response regulator
MSGKLSLSRLKNYRLKVLIADDNADARRGTRLMLSIHPGVEVVAIAQNGYQAISMARDNPPDLVITDIHMPDLDGVDTIIALRTFLPEAMFIVMSADDDSKMIRRAISVGASEYLVKPFDIDDLDKAVRRCAQTWFARRIQSATTPTQEDTDQQSLVRLAHVYAKSRRTDNAALDVFEQLAAQPDCELRWLLTLAMIYVVRQQWGKLKHLSERMEKRTISDT